MSFSAKQKIRAFRAALDAGELDDAAVQLHRLPEVAKPAARAELAKLRGETEKMRRFDARKAGYMTGPPGVSLRSRQG